jgi:hypothetical protein
MMMYIHRVDMRIYSQGTDMPGTGVALQLKRQQDGEIRTVALKRMPSIIIAGRLKLYDLFTELKQRTAQDHTAQVNSLVDQCIETWTDMTSADTQRNENLYSSVMALQNDSSSWLQMLDDNLRNMLQELRTTSELSVQQTKLYRESVAQLEQTRNKESEMQMKTAKMEERLSQNDKASAELAATSKQLASAHADVLALKKEMELQRIASNRLSDTLNFEKRELEGQRVLLKKEVQMAGERESRLKAEVQSWQGRSSVVSSSVRSGREAKLQAEVDALNKMVAELEQKAAAGPNVKQLEDELALRQTKLAATLEEWSHSQKVFSETIRKKEKAVADHQQINTNVKERLLEQKEFAASSHRQLNFQLQATREREDKLKAELAAANDTMAMLAAHVETLERQHAQKSNEDIDTQTLREAAKGTADKLLQVSAELARTSEAANSVTSNLKQALLKLEESAQR